MMWWDKPIPKKKVKCRMCGHVWETETRRRKWIIAECPNCWKDPNCIGCAHDILKEQK